jgi:hypothetical protein
LNENPNWLPDRPNYSVGAPNPNTINGFASYFVKWDDSQPTQISFQDANATQTGVVFKLSNATATAKYKAHFGSSLADAASTNSQRKLVGDTNVPLWLGYTSIGQIWLTQSEDMMIYRGPASARPRRSLPGSHNGCPEQLVAGIAVLASTQGCCRRNDDAEFFCSTAFARKKSRPGA